MNPDNRSCLLTKAGKTKGVFLRMHISPVCDSFCAVRLVHRYASLPSLTLTRSGSRHSQELDKKGGFEKVRKGGYVERNSNST